MGKHFKCVREMADAPWYYGKCWDRPWHGDIVTCVIPLNILARLLNAFMLWAQRPFWRLDDVFCYHSMLDSQKKMTLELSRLNVDNKTLQIILDGERHTHQNRVKLLSATIDDLREELKQWRNTPIQTDGNSTSTTSSPNP